MEREAGQSGLGKATSKAPRDIEQITNETKFNTAAEGSGQTVERPDTTIPATAANVA